MKKTTIVIAAWTFVVSIGAGQKVNGSKPRLGSGRLLRASEVLTRQNPLSEQNHPTRGLEAARLRGRSTSKPNAILQQIPTQANGSSYSDMAKKRQNYYLGQSENSVRRQVPAPHPADNMKDSLNSRTNKTERSQSKAREKTVRVVLEPQDYLNQKLNSRVPAPLDTPTEELDLFEVKSQKAEDTSSVVSEPDVVVRSFKMTKKADEEDQITLEQRLAKLKSYIGGKKKETEEHLSHSENEKTIEKQVHLPSAMAANAVLDSKQGDLEYSLPKKVDVLLQQEREQEGYRKQRRGKEKSSKEETSMTATMYHSSVGEDSASLSAHSSLFTLPPSSEEVVLQKEKEEEKDDKEKPIVTALKEEKKEFVVEGVGTDETSLQPLNKKLETRIASLGKEGQEAILAILDQFSGRPTEELVACLMTFAARAATAVKRTIKETRREVAARFEEQDDRLAAIEAQLGQRPLAVSLSGSGFAILSGSPDLPELKICNQIKYKGPVKAVKDKFTPNGKGELSLEKIVASISGIFKNGKLLLSEPLTITKGFLTIVTKKANVGSISLTDFMRREGEGNVNQLDDIDDVEAREGFIKFYGDGIVMYFSPEDYYIGRTDESGELKEGYHVHDGVCFKVQDKHELPYVDEIPSTDTPAAPSLHGPKIEEVD